MRKYKIGITEAGDAGDDLSWKDKVDDLDGAILITKNVNPEFSKLVVDNKNIFVVHATTTGYGGTVLEPNVQKPSKQLQEIKNLINLGFPKERIVIRVDPIIPTRKGIDVAKNVIMLFIVNGFNRYRVSIIDMYPHVRERFMDANLPLPYGEKFYPDEKQINLVNSMIKEIKEFCKNDVRIECCAEPKLTEAIQCGCISKYDLDLFGLEYDDVDQIGYQRKNCMCYSGKKELLNSKKQCKNKCLYCYWK